MSLSIVLIMDDLHFTGTFLRLISYKPDKQQKLKFIKCLGIFSSSRSTCSFCKLILLLSRQTFWVQSSTTSTSKPKKSKCMLSWPKPASNRLEYWIVTVVSALHFTGTLPRLITFKPDRVNNRNLSSLSVWAFFLQVEAHAAFVNWYYFLADKHFEFRVVLLVPVNQRNPNVCCPDQSQLATD